MEMNKVLITGITGFVGINLKQYLKNKFDVIGISRNKNNNIIIYQDLSKSKFNESKAFIHLAGKAHDLKKTSKDNEAVIPNPITAYGKSKLAAEEFILSQNIPDDKRVYILRPCMIHGPNNKGNLNLLYSFVSKGIPYPFGAYENKRSFLSIENLCFVIEELIKNNISSGIYNVADDEPLSTKELVETIGEAINKKVRIWNIPKVIINLIAKIGDILPLPVNSERVQKLTENYMVSNQKIKENIKKTLPLSVKEGITITTKSFNN